MMVQVERVWGAVLGKGKLKVCLKLASATSSFFCQKQGHKGASRSD
jgi:hypothetical protein